MLCRRFACHHEAAYNNALHSDKNYAALHFYRSTPASPPRNSTCPPAVLRAKATVGLKKGRKNELRYEPGNERVYINAAQYFAPVPEEVWNYKIGGCQVCEKCLKDRKERCLDFKGTRACCRIVTALGLTIDIQRQIGELYPEIEKDLLSIPAVKN